MTLIPPKTTWVTELMSWGRTHYRSFPWRERGADPYLVFIAEFLLRKTSADAVRVALPNLVGSWPSFRELAQAQRDELEATLRPLGLHRVRAQALHSIANTIVSEHRGRLPVATDSIVQLPHCGRYIANAIACIVAGADTPIVDSSIQRFLVRHFGFAPATEIHKADALWEFCARAVPLGYGREFNFALLDYCALVCRPRDDSCGVRGLPSFRTI
jgi:A/G-specific adenine glycosylase